MASVIGSKKTSPSKKIIFAPIENYVIDKQCHNNGFGLLPKMVNSMFGRFLDTFKKLFSKEQRDQYRLPSTIVVGAEKTGKSSLLENITKCSIFPKIENKICTKCPIRLRILYDEKQSYSIKLPSKDTIVIKNSSDIYNYVDAYMKEIKEGTIDDKEIIIEISGPDMPCFEFVDLPGIVAVGPIAKATENLVRKYINDKNNIILCVIPATYQRINTYSPLAIIKELDALGNTIVALTMTDKVQEDYIDLQITDRLLKISDEFEDAKIDNVIAVINHSQRKNRSLIENNKYEEDWFNQYVLLNKEILDKYSKKDMEKIKTLVSSSNIILNLDILYNKYMQTNWKPKVLTTIDSELKELNNQYTLLGVPISEMDKEKFQRMLFARINAQLQTITVAELVTCAKSVMDEKSYKSLRESIIDHIKNNFAKFVSVLIDNIYKMKINEVFAQADLTTPVEEYNNVKMERFVDMKHHVLSDMTKNIINKAELHKDEIYNSSIHKLNYGLMVGSIVDIVCNIMVLIKELVLDGDMEYNSREFTRLYVEDFKYDEQRKQLENKIDNLKKHNTKIINL